MNALTIDQLARFNDSQKRSIRCMIIGHRWANPTFARVQAKSLTSLCELRACVRCKRYKIGKVVKKKLNRKERRR